MTTLYDIFNKLMNGGRTELERQIELELEQEEELTHYRETQALEAQRKSAWEHFNHKK